jgi:DNA (cytosine-5)-methyltransferase 1
MRPRLLDLFCGAGGCAVGYHRAGFDVVGVDIKPQPNYPFEFHQADATALVRDRLGGCWHEDGSKSALPGRLAACLGHFDAIHASPPCQAHTALQTMPNAREHPDLVGSTRDLLKATGLPYVIENVPGAPLLSPVVLCGASFGLGADGRHLARHRLFESSFPIMVPPCAHAAGRVIGIYGDHARKERRHGAQSQYGAVDGLRFGREAMGIDWMEWPELAQAIPPAYCEHIGHYLLAAVESTRRAA